MNLLSITWDLNPVLFQLGSFQLRWYSILFVSGIFPVGYLIMKSFYRRERVPVTLMEPLLWAIFVGTLVGARLGHVLFYDPVYYLTHPWKIIMTWEGGLASHGGAIGVLLAIWWYVHKYGKKHGFDFIWLLDRLVIPVCFAGAMIRLGNFCNSEIYGNPTDLPWGVVFTLRGETVPKHPTQLYEALSYIVLGLSLLWVYLKKLPKLKLGTIFGVFLIGLFGARFLIEYVKEPQEAFEEGMMLNMGQILSIPFILAGIALLIWSFSKGKSAAARVVGNKTGKGGNGNAESGKSGAPKGAKKKVELKHVRTTDTERK